MAKTIQVFEFSELSADAKKRVLRKFADINTGHQWWESVYDDAKSAGLKIDVFSIYNGQIEMKYTDTAANTAKLIKANHGKDCDTYKLAVKFEQNKSEDQFLSNLSKAYLKMLEKELDYRESEAAVIETIEANEYVFTADGTHVG